MQKSSIDLYKSLILPYIKEGSVSSATQQSLYQYRKYHGITEEVHREALEELGSSWEGWLACTEGEEAHSETGYGPPKCQEVYYSTRTAHRKQSYCSGLIVAPHLRQWYNVRDGKKDTFWREKSERKASWLELFFDLVFVTIVYSLSHTTMEHDSPAFEFVLMYSVFFRIWITITSYSTRYEHSDWFHSVIYCGTMLGLLFMNILMPDTFKVLVSNIGEHEVTDSDLSMAIAFSVLYILTHLPVLFQYLFAGWAEITGRAIINNSQRRTNYHPFHMAIILSISLIPWIVSASTRTPYPFYYWFGSVLFANIASYFVDCYNYVTAPICVEHWGERLLLFLMLHLGETTFAVATDFSSSATHWEPYVASAFGLLIPFSFRRVVFEVEGHEPKNPHALRRNRWCSNLVGVIYWLLCMSTITYAIGFSGLQRVNLRILQGSHLDPQKFFQLHKSHPFLPSQQIELDSDIKVNCTSYLQYHSKRFLSASLSETTETSGTIENSTDSLCSIIFNQEKYSFLYRQSEFLFFGSMALIVFCVALLGCMSVTDEQIEKEYLVPHSSTFRFISRLIIVAVFVILPVLTSICHFLVG
eukprot:TRINITY_DN15025_c0_g1_i2.p1 TRINITY_DN15025_c0_g1~~TRINITY_DN15025_c0_g1_i2.p1  ORF type:complete len:586 (+),score=121.53 TRINITY_DN15025_c0_g1_i2:7-1764(+)